MEVLSTGPDLYVEFVANSEWPGQGFKAMFQFQPLDDAPHPGWLRRILLRMKFTKIFILLSAYLFLT